MMARDQLQCQMPNAKFDSSPSAPATHSFSLSLSSATTRRKSKESVEVLDNSGDEMLTDGRLNSVYMKKRLDSLTFLCEQFVKQDKNDDLIDNLRMAVQNCKNQMKLIDSDVDVNLMLGNVEMLKDYLKDIYRCYENALKSRKKK